MATGAKSATKAKKAPAKKKTAGTVKKKAPGSAKKTTAKKTSSKTAKKTTKKATAKKSTASRPKMKAATKSVAKAPARPATKSAAKKSPSGSALDKGMRAPEFSLRNTDGDTISLRDYLGRKHVVLYFYPRDMTPGCTIQACAFRDRKSEMEDLGAVVLGVSPDSVESHGKFTSMHGLNFPLLADEGAELAKKYDVWKEKNLYGNKSMGIERSTFLIDRDGKVARVWRRVKVEGHDDDVIAALEDL